MGRASVKEDKTPYQVVREELGLSREKASELLQVIMPDRIEKIENEKTLPRADEVLVMAEKYKRPTSVIITAPSNVPLVGNTYPG